MSDLIFHVLSWPTLGIALLVWGFAPGAVLRLILLAFERGDPRRRELLGELYAVPRIERPFWVAEQLEVAIVEGLGQRLLWAATGRIIDRWHLGSAVRRNRDHPDTFLIPAEEERHAVVPGMHVKLMFETRHGGDRMWVEVTEVKKRKLVGTLLNLPIMMPRPLPGDTIKFRRDHIIDIWYDDAPEQIADGGGDPDSDRPCHRMVCQGCSTHHAAQVRDPSRAEADEAPTPPPPSSS